MISDRPYKRAISHEAAIAELREHAGTQFDPELVGLFCDLYATSAPKPDPTIVAIIEPFKEAGERRTRRHGTAVTSRTMAADASGTVDLEERLLTPPHRAARGIRPGPGEHGVAAS